MTRKLARGDPTAGLVAIRGRQAVPYGLWACSTLAWGFLLMAEG